MKKPAQCGLGGAMEMLFAMILKPFLVLGFLTIGYPITYYVKHKMRDGWLKRLLLRRIS